MSIAANGNFRQSMKWLHTWAGLTVAVVLYFMFITGSAGYFNDEITHWMKPETPMLNSKIDQHDMLVIAEKRLAKVAPDSSEWWVDFPVGRSYKLNIFWKEMTNNNGKMVEEWKDETLDLYTGEPVTIRKTGGGDTLYYMHYALYYIPTVIAYWITSLCAMFMLIGLISGIVIHKQIFKDFFTFKPGKKQHSWRDMHNVLSVLPLPFHLMITYSGLLFLMFTTMPGVLTASYGTGDKNIDRFYDAIYSQGAEHKDAAGISAENINLSRIFSDIELRWGKDKVTYIGIENRGDINAHIEVAQYGYDGLENKSSLTYNALTGDLQHANRSDDHSAPTQFYETMTMLHEGSFSGPLLRWLYFVSGLMGAAMIATGMILWASKRRERADKKCFASNSLIMVERLNVGTLVGLLIAIAIYFWANRLLPVSFAERGNWEVHSLFISWAIMLAYPYVVARNRSINKIWVDQLTIAAVLYGLLPLLNFLTTDIHLGNTLLSGHWVLAGFDLTMLVFSLLFGFSACRMSRKESKKSVVVKGTVITRRNQTIKIKKATQPVDMIKL